MQGDLIDHVIDRYSDIFNIRRYYARWGTSLADWGLLAIVGVLYDELPWQPRRKHLAYGPELSGPLLGRARQPCPHLFIALLSAHNFPKDSHLVPVAWLGDGFCGLATIHSATTILSARSPAVEEKTRSKRFVLHN